MGEVVLPAGIGETEVDLLGHGGVEGGGDALKAGELSVIRRSVGAGEGSGGNEFGGAHASTASGGGNAPLGGGGEPDGGGLGGGHEAQV